MLRRLPEELLHYIVEYLAYKEHPPDCALPDHHFKRSTPELRSLLVVNRRLQRICMPFLYAYLYIHNADDVEKLKHRCAAGSIPLESVKDTTELRDQKWITVKGRIE